MNYGYVENNQVVEGPRRLPSSWRNISGFDKMSQEALKAVGWLPWNSIYTPGEVRVKATINIGPDSITETVERRPLNEQELAEREAARIASIDEQRRAAYASESDPVFFRWQRGEATQQEWLDKIAEIKTRFPK